MFLGESEEIEPHLARYLTNEERNSLNFCGFLILKCIAESPEDAELVVDS
jgi:hypothetical protein